MPLINMGVIVSPTRIPSPGGYDNAASQDGTRQQSYRQKHACELHVSLPETAA
jgi:hypothetical protein